MYNSKPDEEISDKEMFWTLAGLGVFIFSVFAGMALVIWAI